eukprot:m.78278 g.78278  ORF g.78278 m.78278 type:complete len:162 (+) comp10682_c0_seq1:2698-3183(+)
MLIARHTQYTGAKSTLRKILRHFGRQSSGGTWHTTKPAPGGRAAQQQSLQIRGSLGPPFFLSLSSCPIVSQLRRVGFRLITEPIRFNGSFSVWLAEKREVKGLKKPTRRFTSELSRFADCFYAEVSNITLDCLAVSASASHRKQSPLILCVNKRCKAFKHS